MGYLSKTCWPGLCHSQKFHIHYPKQFRKTPNVLVSLAGLDNDYNHNVRIIASARDVTRSSFDIQLTTWAGTRIYYVKFSWIACT